MLSIYRKQTKSKAESNKFHTIANYIAKADDGQNSSDCDKSDMLDDPKDRAEGKKVVEVDDAGPNCDSDAPANDGNEFNKKGSASTDNYGKGPDDQDGDEKDKQIKASTDIRDPNRGPVIEDKYKSGDECKVTEASIKGGKPSQTVIDNDDNHQNSLDDDKDPAGNIHTGTYNKQASPETDPKKKVPDYTPPSKKESSPNDQNNRTTLDPKLQYKVKSSSTTDCEMGMDDGETEDKPAKADSIKDSKEHEDIMPKSEANIYHDETREAVEAMWQSLAYISQEERDQVDESDFAGPHRSFPIRNAHDVQSASKLIGHGANPTSIKRKIIQIAKKKNLTHALPDSWKAADEHASAYEQALALFNRLSPEDKKTLADSLDWQEQSVRNGDQVNNG